MKELELVKNVKKQALTDSLMAAEYFDKRHDNVLRNIERMLDRGILNKEDVCKGVYRCRGKSYPMYHLGDRAIDVLSIRRDIHTSNYKAIQDEYTKVICETFPRLHFELEHELAHGLIRVDMYCQELNLAIEIDEKEHNKLDDENKDLIMECELKKISERYGIVRIKEGRLGDGLRYLLYHITKLSEKPIIGLIAEGR